MPRLRVEYEAIEQALTSIANMRDNSNSALGSLAGSVDDMMSSWKGLGGQAFGNWWSSVATVHGQELLNEFDSLERKLRNIRHTIEDLDQAGAALFKQK